MMAATRPQRARIALLLAGLALAACTSNEASKVEENVFPSDYRKAIVTQIMTTKAFDPTNIREAAVSEPALKPVAGNVMRYVVCMRFNARDDLRKYTGLTERIVYFYAGDINQIHEAGRDQCAWATYQPFPELEKICLSEREKCK